MRSSTSSRVGPTATTPREVREVCTPPAILGALEDHYVLAHRRCSRSLALQMLESVPTGTMSLSLPATTIGVASPGLPQTSWDPRCRKTQPASFSAKRISRYFFGMHRKKSHGRGQTTAEAARGAQAGRGR